MKAICISNYYNDLEVHKYENLTIGKIYDVEFCTLNTYLIIDDYDEHKIIRRSLFIDIEIFRNDKLEKLGV